MEQTHQIRIQTQPQIQGSQYQGETQYQSQKKLTNLFYVRSKHTQKYFRNHPYFVKDQNGLTLNEEKVNQIITQKQQRNRKLINQKRFRTQTCPNISQNYKQRKSNEFVDYPAQFGLQNTYTYLRDKSFLNSRSQKKQTFRSKKSNPFKREERKLSMACSENQNQKKQRLSLKNYMKNTAAYQSKFLHSASSDLQRQGQKHHGQKLNSTYFVNSTKISIHAKMSTRSQEPSQGKIIASKSFHQSMLPSRNIIYNAPQSRIVSKLHNQSAKNQVCFIYGKRIKSFAQIPYRQINFDILPFTINTFLKCKIHYKDMTQEQFQFIKNSIVKVLQVKRKGQKYDIKDIINIGSIQGVIRFLNQFENMEKDYQWVETIRYFFLTKEEKIVDYQLNKIKEQVAKLISIKYDAEFGQRQLFIFNTQTKEEVNSFYDLFKDGKFMIGDDPNIRSEYQAIQNEQNEHRSLQSKIKRWKSITSCDTQNEPTQKRIESSKSTIQRSGPPQPAKNIIFSTNKVLTEQRFNNLFEQFKVRQKKRVSKNLSNFQNVIVPKNPQSFIQRSKLKREEDIFE